MICQCNLAPYPVCVQGLSTSYQGNWCEGTGCQLLGSDWGWWLTSGLWCHLLEPVKSQCQVEPVGSLISGHWGGSCVCVSQKTALGGTCLSEGLSTRSWTWSIGHSPCAGCQLLGVSVCTCPKPGLRGVCRQIPKLDQPVR